MNDSLAVKCVESTQANAGHLSALLQPALIILCRHPAADMWSVVRESKRFPTMWGEVQGQYSKIDGEMGGVEVMIIITAPFAPSRESRVEITIISASKRVTLPPSHATSE